jgi:hypothetical protein
MWTSRIKKLENYDGISIQIDFQANRASFDQVAIAWRNDPGLQQFFSDLLAGSPFQAFRWETPALTAATISRPFECVLLNSPELLVPADDQAFAEHFALAKGAGSVSFPNLRGDALLVVPCPLTPSSSYAHLASFLRTAPATQSRDLWHHVAEVVQSRLSSKPFWLSTAGAGVSWLHVRLDDRPKYYGYAPYRELIQ